MSSDSIHDLAERLTSRRIMLRQATDAAAMQALRDDIIEIERLLASRLESPTQVLDFVTYKQLTRSA